MPDLIAPEIRIIRNGVPLKTRGGTLTIVNNEPQELTADLDNDSGGDYKPASAVAQVRDFVSALPLTVRIDSGGTAWTSSDFLVDEYQFRGDAKSDEVALECSCKLSELDLDDQYMPDLVATTVGAAASDIATEYGLTVNGAPSRNLRGPYHRNGNPLDWMGDVLEPLSNFRMGAGSQLEIFPATPGPVSHTYIDKDWIQKLDFRRSKRVQNEATVERVVEAIGVVNLVDEALTGGTSLGGPQTVSLSSPSRSFRFIQKYGQYGVVEDIVLLDGGGLPIAGAPAPYNSEIYEGAEAVHSIQFNYNLKPGALTWGPFEPNWEIQVEGSTLAANPVPIEGFSETRTAGLGDRPYPDPFSTLILDNATDAGQAAQVFADEGQRRGTVLVVTVRVTDDFPMPGGSIQVIDARSGLSVIAVVELVRITWAEGSDPGTLRLECSVLESP